MEELGAGYCPWGHKELGTTERLHLMLCKIVYANNVIYDGAFSHLVPAWWTDRKESACNAAVLGSVLGLRRSPGEGNGYPFQYSCAANSMD